MDMLQHAVAPKARPYACVSTTLQGKIVRSVYRYLMTNHGKEALNYLLVPVKV